MRRVRAGFGREDAKAEANLGARWRALASKVIFLAAALVRRRACNLEFFGARKPSAMASEKLHPGQVAPRSGVYRVHHYAHRLPHAVIVLEGDLLPTCALCGPRVTFEFTVGATPISCDPNFAAAFEKGAAS
jgi:hypothetical protein